MADRPMSRIMFEQLATTPGFLESHGHSYERYLLQWGDRHPEWLVHPPKEWQRHAMLANLCHHLYLTS